MTGKAHATASPAADIASADREAACGCRPDSDTCSARGERSGVVQRCPDGSDPGCPCAVDDVLHAPGHPIEPAARAGMERRFGTDFSHVRVHTDASAAESARTLRARAYTSGKDIVFGAGQYQPTTGTGLRLLAHELTHVVQQGNGRAPAGETRIGASDDRHEREADTAAGTILGAAPVVPAAGGVEPGRVQRAGFFESIGNFFSGIGQGIARFFGGGTFSDQELQTYLTALATNRRIEDRYDSDNKAREVVRRWRAGDPRYRILTVPTRTLLIKEMLSGFVAGDDQSSILALLRESIPGERAHILTEVGEQNLRQAFGGDNLRALNRLLDDQPLELMQERSTHWTVAGVMRVLRRHGDERVIQQIVNLGYRVFSYTEAYTTWGYPDGRKVEEASTRVHGNTCFPGEGPECPVIRVRERLNNEDAASVLAHEIDHARQRAAGPIGDYLEGEAQARVAGEQFNIRHGLPPVEPDYRRPDGTIDVNAIRASVVGSGHYNPSDRQFVRRRYVGDKNMTGWQLPASPAAVGSGRRP